MLAPAQRADLIVDFDAEPGTKTKINALADRQRVHIGDIVYHPTRRRRAKPLGDPITLPDNPMPRDLQEKGAIETDLGDDRRCHVAIPRGAPPGRDLSDP